VANDAQLEQNRILYPAEVLCAQGSDSSAYSLLTRCRQLVAHCFSFFGIEGYECLAGIKAFGI